MSTVMGSRVRHLPAVLSARKRRPSWVTWAPVQAQEHLSRCSPWASPIHALPPARPFVLACSILGQLFAEGHEMGFQRLCFQPQTKRQPTSHPCSSRFSELDTWGWSEDQAACPLTLTPPRFAEAPPTPPSWFSPSTY